MQASIIRIIGSLFSVLELASAGGGDAGKSGGGCGDLACDVRLGIATEVIPIFFDAR